MAEDLEASVHLRPSALTRRATVRAFDGVFDLELIAGQWRCSCGHDGCCHVAKVELAMADVVDD